jgi:hypothetical protein
LRQNLELTRAEIHWERLLWVELGDTGLPAI